MTTENVGSSFQKGVIAKMEAMELNPLKLAGLAGVPHQTVYRLINDGSEPKLETAHRVAAALGSTVDDLIKEGKDAGSDSEGE